MEYELRQQIMALCGDFSWFDEKRSAEAHAALQEVYDLLKRAHPDRVYDAGASDNHFGYLHHLIVIRNALLEKKFSRAANEVGTLAYTQPILQPRICHNLLPLLEQYGGIRNVSFQKEDTAGIGSKQNL